MPSEISDVRVQKLAEGFSSLLDEYNDLLVRSQRLQESLLDAKTQFEQFVTTKGTVSKSDLQDFVIHSSTKDIEDPLERQVAQEKWWTRNDIPMKRRNLTRTRSAVNTLQELGISQGNSGVDDATSKISSDPIQHASSAMPSISESPLEQDFTVPGTPSRLDCPFASMTNRRLSSHAASVVSRYRPSGAITPRSSTSRVISRASAHQISALSAHGSEVEQEERSPIKQAELETSIQGSAPVCPIRFLEKSPPEEVAEYFEKHKHELPRSHEICVKRYQSNAESIKQLDAKYGSLVGMIQGLGQKHAPMLPGKTDEQRDGEQDGESAERVRRWASGVSDTEDASKEAVDNDERESRFDRPLKDVRLGESPSRPWGIQVPVPALKVSDVPIDDVVSATPERLAAPRSSAPVTVAQTLPKSAGKCPFGHGAGPKIAADPLDPVQATKQPTEPLLPVFLANSSDAARGGQPPGMTFTGPVFIGYSAEQAVQVLQALGRT